MADARDTVTLAIDGVTYSGWTGVRISRSIESIAGEFDLSLTARERLESGRFPLAAGSAITLGVGGETLISGHIDRLSAQYDMRSHVITISGRDRAGDLADCSAIHPTGSWKNTSVEAIAAELAAPFGIAVTARAPTGAPIKRFALQQGETVAAAIERLVRYRGLLVVSTPAGAIELISPASGDPVARLAEGDAILAGIADHDVTERFSEYRVKGQSSGDDQVNGRAAAQPAGTARDPAVRRYRPLLVIGEEQSDRASLGIRAAWEASVRAGRAQRITIGLAGWRRGDGQIWTPNVIVEVDAPSLYVRGPMLVAGVTLQLDQNGTIAELEMSPPGAFTAEPVSEDADASAIGASA